MIILYSLLIFFLSSTFVISIQVVSDQQEFDTSDARFAQAQDQLPSLSKLTSALSSKLSSPRFNGASSSITVDDEECVMCQYYVQRLQSSMVQYAIQFQKLNKNQEDGVFLEMETDVEKSTEAAEAAEDATEVENLSLAETSAISEPDQNAQKDQKDKKTDWFLSLQKAENIVADAFKDDETLKKKSQREVLTDDTFYAPIGRPHHPPSSSRASHSTSASTESTESARTEASTSTGSSSHRRHPFESVRFLSGVPKKNSDGTKPKGSGMVSVSASRRQRVVEARMATPVTMRYLSPGGEFVEMETTLFNDFVKICGDQPLAYGRYCDNILEQFPFIVQGLDSRDTPQRICLNLNFCDQNSYAVGAPHALEEMRAEDVH